VRNGVKNSVALGGTSVPDRIPSIVGDRKVTAFLDGDRGGDLILEELESKLDLDSVARAPENLEVEELSEKQIYEALRDKESSKYVESEEVQEFELEEEERNRVLEVMDDLVATRAVNLLNQDLEVIEKFPADMIDGVEQDNVYAVFCDSEINEEIVNLAEDMDASYVVGRTLSGTANSSDVHLLSEEQLRD